MLPRSKPRSRGQARRRYPKTATANRDAARRFAGERPTDETDADPETKPPAATEPPPTEGHEPSKAQPGDGEDADLVEVNVLGKIELVVRKELVRGYRTT